MGEGKKKRIKRMREKTGWVAMHALGTSVDKPNKVSLCLCFALPCAALRCFVLACSIIYQAAKTGRGDGWERVVERSPGRYLFGDVALFVASTPLLYVNVLLSCSSRDEGGGEGEREGQASRDETKRDAPPSQPAHSIASDILSGWVWPLFFFFPLEEPTEEQPRSTGRPHPPIRLSGRGVSSDGRRECDISYISSLLSLFYFFLFIYLFIILFLSSLLFIHSFTHSFIAFFFPS